MKKHNQTFDSFGDFLKYLKDAPRNWPDNRAHEKGHADFRGTDSYGEADALARNGWPEGRDRLDRALTSAAAAVTMQTTPAQWYDVAGSYPCVAMACAGDPMNMVNHGETVRAQRPVARFLISIASSASVSMETITTRGAAILSWIDALEAQEIRCEIVTHMGSGNHAYATNAYITVKRAQDPLEIDRLAYTLAHPSMARRHGIACMERSPSVFQNMGRNYGSPTVADVERDQIYFTAMHIDNAEWRNPTAAAAYVKAQIIAGGFLKPDDTLAA